MKRLILLSLIIIILGGSCMPFNTRESVRKRAIKYMEKKYDDEFIMLTEKEDWPIIPDDYQVSSKSHPEWVAEVTWDSEDNIFGDNYVGYLINDELEETIASIVEPIYGNCKVFAEPIGFWDTEEYYGQDVSLEDMKPYGPSTAGIFVSTDMSTKDEDLKKFKIGMRDNDLLITVDLLYVNDELLDKATRDTHRKYYGDRENYYKRITLIDEEDYNADKNQWDDGELND